jgi:hypothetical protein
MPNETPTTDIRVLDSHELLTLVEAAKVSPGRPSMFCIWRWCRKGGLSRDGERLRLQHVRVGGRIFTSKRWLDEFGKQIAEADVRYFAKLDNAARSDRRRRQPRERSETERQQYLRELDQKLAAMGL